MAAKTIEVNDRILRFINLFYFSGTYTIAYRSVVVDSIPPVPEYHRAEVSLNPHLPY